MRLNIVGLQEEGFFPQFLGLMDEFDEQIPWLRGLEDLRRLGPGEELRNALIERILEGRGTISAYQLIGSGGVFIGGLLLFSRIPEHFENPTNQRVVNCLETAGAGYLTCLFITPEYRSLGFGRIIMERSIVLGLKTFSSLFGVTSSPQLRAWHESMGAITLSSSKNQDNLWIIYWNRS
ncbi:MAG: hypothetical protein WC730_02670 [Patescibacteria group bacterium]|jgi:GNAT superfamily N-acetyltransferase